MSDLDRLHLIRPDRRTHRQAVLDLTGKTFGSPYWGWLEYCTKGGYVDGSHYDWDASTIGLIGTEIVTHWGIWGYDMRVGSGTLRTAGIGGVATHGERRKRGLMAATAAEGCRAAREAGYDVSVLFGISDFYHRFRYVRAWPGHAYRVEFRHLPTLNAPGRMRKIPPRHRQDLAALYNLHAEGLTGTAVRPTYGRRAKTWSGWMWTDEAGAAAGYVFADAGGENLDVVDCAGETDAVLGALRRLCRRLGKRHVVLPSLHHDCELARRLRRGTCRIETRYTRRGDAMIRTLDLNRCLARLGGELERRLKASPLADWSGNLLIDDGEDKATLAIGDGKVAPAGATRTRHAVRGGAEIAQLLIGTDDPLETAAAFGTALTGDAADLLAALFPARDPTLAVWDHF